MLTVVLLLTEDELVSASTTLVSSDRAILPSTWRTEDTNWAVFTREVQLDSFLYHN